MANPYRCVLAWWATQHLPAPRAAARARCRRTTARCWPCASRPIRRRPWGSPVSTPTGSPLDGGTWSPICGRLITDVPPWIRRGRLEGGTGRAGVPGPVM